MQRPLPLVLAACALGAWLPSAALAQPTGNSPHPTIPADAAVDFGVLPTAPLGPPPCLQSGAIGGPADPCAYKIHHLVPEEVTILKDGQVTFQVHGGGHAMALYEVSTDTTRDDLGQFLCAGVDPQTVDERSGHPPMRPRRRPAAPTTRARRPPRSRP